MKRITIIIACLLVSVSGAMAQDINTSFAQKMDSLFAGIDKSKVPHGILLDYGMENITLSGNFFSFLFSIILELHILLCGFYGMS